MRKITVGFVIQEYNESGDCTSQEFVASEQADWEDDDGEPATMGVHVYQVFDMVQPIKRSHAPLSEIDKVHGIDN